MVNESGISENEMGFDLVRLGTTIRAIRRERGLTLDGLANRAEISRSMVVAVEAGTKAPTVLVLHKIATGLGTSMSHLLGEEQPDRVQVLRRADQVVARDPSGWERRNLAPVLPGVDFELMRTSIPSGVNAGLFPPHAHGSREYVAVETGRLDLTIDGVLYRLDEGDSVYYPADCEHGFANSGDDECIYYLAVQDGVHGTKRR